MVVRFAAVFITFIGLVVAILISLPMKQTHYHAHAKLKSGYYIFTDTTPSPKCKSKSIKLSPGGSLLGPQDTLAGLYTCQLKCLNSIHLKVSYIPHNPFT